jgi:ATP-dependent DNA helicase RecG
VDENAQSDLLLTLLGLPEGESEWVEYKENNDDPDEIARQLAALSNSAALHGKDRSFIVWGVRDTTRKFVGTRFKPRAQKVGNEELENWLCTQLVPQVQFWIHEFEFMTLPAVIVEVEAATHAPIAFKGERYIRIGTITKPLRKHREKEAALWRIFSRQSFEIGIAATRLSAGNVLQLINFQDYFRLTDQPMPVKADVVVRRLCEDELARPAGGGTYDVTNLGAILFARDVYTFDKLRRKAVRVIFYQDDSRAKTSEEYEGRKGYASGFQGLIAFILKNLPKSEEIQRALRVSLPIFPEVAIRELAANALIHQDLDAAGTGPVIEVFSDRIEFTNPGVPLIDVRRLLDLPPRSRNEKLAHLMRRLSICEERGSGIDKVLLQAEIYQLPPPDFELAGDNTKAVLYSPRTFAQMTKGERLRACYQHAGLQYVSNKQMTNETLRKRFGFTDKNKAMASRVISDALEARLIRSYDPTSRSRRHARYVPYWA